MAKKQTAAEAALDRIAELEKALAARAAGVNVHDAGTVGALDAFGQCMEVLREEVERE